MKKQSPKKAKRASSKRVAEKPSPIAVVTSGVPSAPVVVTLDQTDPRVLFELADQEPDQRELAEYIPVIEKLRSKNFSYREIAQWFSEHGVELDHNTVYRLYTKRLSDEDAHYEAQRADEEEQDEAFRNSR